MYWAYKTGLTPPLFIGVNLPSHASEQSFIFVLEVSMLPLSTICLLDFGNIRKVLFFWFSFYYLGSPVQSRSVKTNRLYWTQNLSLQATWVYIKCGYFEAIMKINSCPPYHFIISGLDCISKRLVILKFKYYVKISCPRTISI